MSVNAEHGTQTTDEPPAGASAFERRVDADPTAPRGCKASPRCEHPWWFDVMYQWKRYRMPVDVFALARGAKQPVASKQEAEKVWEPKFIGEIVSGKDPRKAPAPPTPEIDLHWHDLRHEAACRWLAKGLDLRAIQLLLGHADLKTTQRCLNVTDEELRKTMQEKLWKRK